jgi:type IV secretory pathway VirD2 relaxase
MAADDFEPKLGRIRDPKKRTNLRTTKRILEHAAKSGGGLLRQRGHIAPGTRRRGMAPGVLAHAGLIAPGSRRVIVRARYARQPGGDLGAARAHLRYIQRDGVTRDGEPGQLYDAHGNDAKVGAFLDRSESDPHQFRFIVSAEDSPRLRDLKPFVRDLMRQMEQDLDTKLDWVAVDHFNTGHPHTHIVVRGRDDQGRDLVMARDYIGHGIRARAQSLVTLELGPETEMERLQKLMNEVSHERFTRLDRDLLTQAKENILVIGSGPEQDGARQTMRVGRLKVLERMGLASERQTGVWQLDAGLETKLRRLGERADTYKMMQRALFEAGIDRGARLALFESGRRQTPITGKVIANGLVDEITDRHYVIVDGADGRVHYAELGRLRPQEVPHRGTIVSLVSDSLHGRPKSVVRLKVLSPVALETLSTYDGPTWLDRALAENHLNSAPANGFGAELQTALGDRRRWLAERALADLDPSGKWAPKSGMAEALHAREHARIVQGLSRQLNATYLPNEPGSRISGVYDRAVDTPTGKLAVIRREDTYTLAPWKAPLEPMRGQFVTAVISSNRVTWSLDRGRQLPTRE